MFDEEESKKGLDEGERCLERGSGVRDWKTEEARKLHSNLKQLRSSVCLTLDYTVSSGSFFFLQ